MKFKPRGYQQRMIDFTVESAFGLDCADMGLGKTASTLAAIDTLVYDMMTRRRVLVVAPKRVAYRSWPGELRKWDDFRHMNWATIDAADFGLTPEIVEPAVFHDDGSLWIPAKKSRNRFVDKKASRIALLNRREEIHIVSFDFFPWLVELLKNCWPYDVVIYDEMTFLKNPDTERWRSARAVRKMLKSTFGLTGTPAPGGITDLWAPMYLMDGGQRLGKTLQVFREAYCTPVLGNGGKIFGWVGRDEACRAEVRSKVAEISISLRSEDYLQLPQRIDNVIPIELPPAARAMYDEVERAMFHRLDDASAVVAVNRGVLVGKLLQIANGAVYDDLKAPRAVHDAKLDVLEELLESTPGNLLVAISYKPDRDRILKRFSCARSISGVGVQDAWEKGQVKMMVTHPAEGAHGLNIQEGGDTVVWFGQQHSLERYQQLNKRLHRSGQLSDRVVVHHLVAENTIEEDVLRGLEEDRDEQELLLQAIRDRRKRLQQQR